MRLRWAPGESLARRLAAGLVRLLAATWRYRVHGWEHVAQARASGRPIVYVLWHSRILPLLYHRRGEAVALLISRHRDGGYLAELSERWGYRVVRGSSRRGGEVGLLGLVRSLVQGAEVALTPDGPRGPAERMKPGALAAAQHAHALVIAAGARAASAWWIQSWDRFLIPKPFAAVEVVYSAPLAVGEGKDALRHGLVEAERALHAVTYGGEPGEPGGTAGRAAGSAGGRREPLSAARVVAWLWSGAPLARVARLPLTPLALLYWAGMRLRTAAYRAGWRRVARLPLPSVAVGNLSVGGTGKTPLAAWIARYCAARGHRPGIVLRGYGGDEVLVHQRLVPEAVVVANPDRPAATQAAAARGAVVVVLDDAYQLLGVARDLNIAVLSADSVGASVWPLPAGPWREGADALARAGLIVVTRKRATLEAATGFADWLERRCPGAPVCIAHLALSHLELMRSGTRVPLGVLEGRRVVAAAGIADPASFAAQLRAAGASVQLLPYQDHHAYRPADLARLARAAAGGDYVVVTEKDAVKLRGRWPEQVAEPLVAGLEVRWERNGRALEQALDAVLASAARA